MRSASVIEELRARIASIEGVATRHAVLPFGIAAIDAHLPGGGIASGALHEVAGSRNLSDDAAATIFLAGILARTDGMVVWALRWADLFAPSLAQAGLDADRVIFVEAGSDTNVLIAMEEALRHPGLAGVVGELGKIGLTASRRLQLAAETSGVPAFVFRRAAKDEGETGGTAAVTRWRVRSSPSERLTIPSLARPRWQVALERARGGEPHLWTVEASDAQGRLALPAELVDRPLAEARRVAS
ncbi:ImuA family protein [Sphingomonas montanisoli]|uniref:Damage-inducible mutagenesis protein n=1 Tax=Sphingomonas montanisoli TaxID=2606412 RepID=A0A5D9C439_9SPHN|nr:damage-inducible mutagenesis protein [Sphingomonas montanisoli]TZG25750.1 damage-inducible mutagenesis protein [Sphingomonas montanisoli]